LEDGTLEGLELTDDCVDGVVLGSALALGTEDGMAEGIMLTEG
jgi:hypothetical protein